MKKPINLKPLLTGILLVIALAAFQPARSASITVTSPNGGETFTAGTSNTITWTSDVTGKLRIVLLKNGIQQSIIAGFVPNTGSFAWNIPATFLNGTDYTIKISSCTSTLVSDVSDANFSIAGGSGTTITVTSPNGGETWVAGTPNTITWTSDVTGNLRIALLKNGVHYAIIASSVPNTGSHVWNIPPGLAPGSTYAIKIYKSTNTQIMDVSDTTFTVNAGGGTFMTLTAPNGGESFTAGTPATITWNSDVTGKIRLVLLNNGNQVAVIAGALPNTGSYTWNIPPYILSGSDYTVKISSYTNTTLSDVSDANFSITGGSGTSLSLTSPNGGETWTVGDTVTITWTGDVTTKLRILLMKGGVQTRIIGGCLASTGTYTWVVPSCVVPDGDYTVKITTCGYLNISDESDAVFTIAGPSPKVSATISEMNSDYTVYPNPATSTVNISSASDIQKVTILNQLGQVVLERECETPQVQLDLNDLKEGIYFLRVESGNQISTRQLLVQ